MIIQLLDGTVYNTTNFNLIRLFHYIPSATVNHEINSLQSRYDEITSTKLNVRNIRVQFLYEASDIFDFYLLRDELHNLFIREEPFYIIFDREPYKRWLVKSNSQLDIPPNPHMQAFDVEFITMNNYAENVFSTGQYTSKEWDTNMYYWNSTITWDDTLAYGFTEKNFSVFNGGNVRIDPRQTELIINVRGVGNLTITNNTTGDVYAYNRALTDTDSLQLNGVRTLINGVSDFRNTNRNLITLAPGNNDFTVTIDTLNNIDFNFRYLYK